MSDHDRAVELIAEAIRLHAQQARLYYHRHMGTLLSNPHWTAERWEELFWREERAAEQLTKRLKARLRYNNRKGRSAARRLRAMERKR